MNWQSLNIDISKIKGDSGKTICPHCSKDRKKQSEPCLSVDLVRGLYNCFHCNWGGALNGKNYAVPREIQDPLSDKAVEWFKSRGINRETLSKMNIKQVAKFIPAEQKEMNTICFNYIRDGVTINIKYRDPKKNFALYKDAELIFYNLDAIKDTKHVVITEGEIDCLSFIEAGIEYCVSVPNGANKNLSYISNSWEYFENKEKIYICVDKDEAGKILENELIKRFGKDKCFIINFPFKDANECLINAGAEELLWALREAKGFPLGDVHYVRDLQDVMITQYERGKERGTTTYLKPLDTHFTWKRGEITLFHGIPNHGKSKLVKYLCMLKSINEGDKWGVFSPEEYPANEFYDDLIHTYLGENIDKSYINRCSKEDYLRGLDFVSKHFFYIYPETKSPTPEYINGKFKDLIIREGITGGILDPYNQLDHQMNKYGRDDLYISEFLTGEKRFAQIHDFYKIIVAHPKVIQKNAKGGYDCPSIYNLHGGSMWANKCDNIIAVHNDRWHEDKAETLRLIDIQKIKKHQLVGTPGEIRLNFNRVTNRYTPEFENI